MPSLARAAVKYKMWNKRLNPLSSPTMKDVTIWNNDALAVVGAVSVPVQALDNQVETRRASERLREARILCESADAVRRSRFDSRRSCVSGENLKYIIICMKTRTIGQKRKHDAR